jgi:hypothetical protein
MMLGLHPLALTDALATPMFDVFTTKPDFRPFDAIQPQQSLTERNPEPPSVQFAATWSPRSSAGTRAAEEHQLALSLPFDKVDLVPQELSDQVLWHSVYGWDAIPPAAGPGASPDEQGRAAVALDAFHEHRDITDALELVSTPDSDDG